MIIALFDFEAVQNVQDDKYVKVSSINSEQLRISIDYVSTSCRMMVVTLICRITEWPMLHDKIRKLVLYTNHVNCNTQIIFCMCLCKIMFVMLVSYFV